MSYFPDASIGATGAPPPAVATFVGGTDGTDLRGFSVDASGKQRFLLYDAAGNPITSTSGALNVNIGGGLANPLPTTDAADGSTAAAVPAKAIQAAGSDGTNLRAFATDTTGRQKVLLYDSAGTAIVLVSGRVPVDGSGVTQPISAASLPLPTGASTAAKQPAIGTAGTPSADVITVQGHSGMTAVDVNITGGGGGGVSAVDESAFTAGTSVFTPEGAVFNDSAAALTSGQQGTGRSTPNRGRHVNLRNQAGTELGVAAAPVQVSLANTAANAVPVDVEGNVASTATDSGNPVKIGGKFNTTQPTVTTGQRVDAQMSARGAQIVVPGVEGFAENLTQLAGTAIDVNSGNKSAGTQRVVLATDQPALTTPLPTSGYLHSSGDVIAPVRAGGKIAASGAFGTSTTPVTLATAAGGQYYYVTSIKFDIDPSVHFSNVFLVSVNDSTDGLIAQWLIFAPSSAVVPTSPIVLTYNSPPEFYYIPSTTGTTLSCKPNNALAAAYLYITVNYGLTTLPG